ncbi:unnamed protein product [Adineta steineri]|uniref:Uncharacterized protein n=1 Tax=Adineta steineri TaxID=433720 RepID=A0A814FEX5_9BILA|nr:unnamed protein product [Adineta steineri]CAF3988495.1 unnamed protein product [Adineta steineri]
MAMANNKRTRCSTCNKERMTYPCQGCSQRFCFLDLREHRQILNEELNCIINDYDQFKQRINERKQNPQSHSLIKQINLWEIKSIEIIQQKAQEYREILMKSSQTCINDIEMKLDDLSKQIKQCQKENKFNEVELNYLRNQLIEIAKEFNNPSNMSIHENSGSLINEISIILSKKPTWHKWKQNGITVAAGNDYGEELNQLDRPGGIFIDKNKNIFIADCYNHRIVEWKCKAKEGLIVAGENKQGNQMNQLNYPTDVIVDQQDDSVIIADLHNRRVIQWMNQTQQILISDVHCSRLAMDKYGFLYVSDCEKNEVTRWKMGEYNTEGIVVAGGNGQGKRLNQLSFPSFIFVDKHQSVYISDRDNHRVMKWRKDAKEGRVVAGGNGEGENLDQLSEPQGVIVDDLGQIYVADSANDRVMRWCEGDEEGEIVVGGNGYGDEPNQLFGPYGLSFDNDGNLYVGDYWNNRIQKFKIIL